MHDVSAVYGVALVGGRVVGEGALVGGRVVGEDDWPFFLTSCRVTASRVL